MKRRSARSRQNRVAIALLLALAALTAVLPTPHSLFVGADPLPGSQGVGAAQPTTKSAVKVKGRGPFSSLQVTVSATRDLVNQAVSVSWTGAPATVSNPTTGEFTSTFNGNYLQIFQCWGDVDPADPLNAGNPGPPPTQCQFGGESNSPSTSYPIQESGFQFSRVLSQPTWSDYESVTGWTDPDTGFKVLPFRAVDGTLVNQQADYNALADPFNPKAFWQNPFFSYNTSNELPFARTYARDGGSGLQEFQVQTGLEAPGLGCGQALQVAATGGKKVPKCWLVVVPRGLATDENPTGLTGQKSVVTSPLSPQAWAHRIAIPLEFRSVSTSCTLGSDERRMVGSELAIGAIGSWQPALCAEPGSPPYAFSYVSDDRARDNLSQPGFASAGMSIFSNAPDAGSLDPAHPPVYAPLTLSGVVVGFNIERTPKLLPDGHLQPDEVPLSGVRVARLFLTPRLVAKLLTESYQAQLVAVTASDAKAYDWVRANPTNLVHDPDFIRFNPEFALLATQQEVDASGLVVEQPTSDAAAAVWQWILADPEAKAWLGGTPDAWGMKVNPLYDSKAGITTSVPASFPKADPYCFTSDDVVGSPPKPARPICVLDWTPYMLTMQAAAQAVGNANSGARTTVDPAGTPETAWRANGPQKAGSRFILSITDTSSARRYGVPTAALSRAGDDGDARRFLTATDGSLLAGVDAMTGPSSQPLVIDPKAAAPDAYPLALVTYGATTPTTLDQAARADYAAFVRYAVQDGQVSGLEAGQLPPGYVPLPASLRAQALAAAEAILHPPAPASSPSSETFSGSTDGAYSYDPGSVPSGDAAPEALAASTTGATKNLQQAKLTGATTAAVDAGSIRWAAAAVFLVGALAAIAVPIVGRRRRAPTGPVLATPDGAAPNAEPVAAVAQPPSVDATTFDAFSPW